MFQISKNRYSGDLGAMPLDFDKSSFGFSKTPVDVLYKNKDMIEIIKVQGNENLETVKEGEDEQEISTRQNWNFSNSWNRLMRA